MLGYTGLLIILLEYDPAALQVGIFKDWKGPRPCWTLRTVALIGLSRLYRISVIQHCKLDNLVAKDNQQYIQNIYCITEKCVLQISTLHFKE